MHQTVLEKPSDVLDALIPPVSRYLISEIYSLNLTKNSYNRAGPIPWGPDKTLYQMAELLKITQIYQMGSALRDFSLKDLTNAVPPNWNHSKKPWSSVPYSELKEIHPLVEDITHQLNFPCYISSDCLVDIGSTPILNNL